MVSTLWIAESDDYAGDRCLSGAASANALQSEPESRPSPIAGRGGFTADDRLDGFADAYLADLDSAAMDELNYLLRMGARSAGITSCFCNIVAERQRGAFSEGRLCGAWAVPDESLQM